MKPDLHVYPTSKAARVAFDEACARAAKFRATGWIARHTDMVINGPDIHEKYGSASSIADIDKFKGNEYRKVYYYGPSSSIRAALLTFER